MKTKNGKFCHLPILLGLVLSMFASRALADVFSQTNSDGVTIYYEAYYEDGATTPIIKVTRSNPNYNEGVVVIPEKVSYNGTKYEVKAIGEGAFDGCGNLTSVTIPSGVIWIENFAFRGCWKLTSVNIPDKVTLIGVEAFNGCCALESINIPNSVEYLSSNAFLNCTSLKTVNIPSSVTDTGDCVFDGCTSLTSVNIPSSLKVIHGWMFRGCTSLASIVIPEGVETIGLSAFYGCTSLSFVTIPSTVTTISEEAFLECRGLSVIKSFIQSPPVLPVSAFSDYDNPILYVPLGSIDQYRNNGWCFVNIVETQNVEGCATPVISYENGKLSFSCETPNATFKWSVTDELAQSGSGAEVELTPVCEVSVYAFADEYAPSDLAKATLWWVEVGQTGGVVTGLKEIQAVPVLIKTGGGNITLEGVADGTIVKVFNVSGSSIGSGEASGGKVTMNTNLPSGTIVIVKIGEKGIKVVL